MICIFCKTGTLAPGRATATFEEHGAVVVIRDVPAAVCQQCGEPYYDSGTSRRLFELVDQAVRSGVKVGIREYAAA